MILIFFFFYLQKVDPELIFTKQERIGKGSFGEVFKGIDNRTQQVIFKLNLMFEMLLICIRIFENIFVFFMLNRCIAEMNFVVGFEIKFRKCYDINACANGVYGV